MHCHGNRFLSEEQEFEQTTEGSFTDGLRIGIFESEPNGGTYDKYFRNGREESRPEQSGLSEGFHV